MFCRRWLLPFLLLLSLLAQKGFSPEDRKRFEEIKARHDRGEQVSEEDRAFAMRITRELSPMSSPGSRGGPYLWGDGVKPRNDGLIWTRNDLGADGTHPSNVGRVKWRSCCWFVKGR